MSGIAPSLTDAQEGQRPTTATAFEPLHCRSIERRHQQRLAGPQRYSCVAIWVGGAQPVKRTGVAYGSRREGEAGVANHSVAILCAEIKMERTVGGEFGGADRAIGAQVEFGRRRFRASGKLQLGRVDRLPESGEAGPGVGDPGVVAEHPRRAFGIGFLPAGVAVLPLVAAEPVEVRAIGGLELVGLEDPVALEEIVAVHRFVQQQVDRAMAVAGRRDRAGSSGVRPGRDQHLVAIGVEAPGHGVPRHPFGPPAWMFARQLGREVGDRAAADDNPAVLAQQEPGYAGREQPGRRDRCGPVIFRARAAGDYELGEQRVAGAGHARKVVAHLRSPRRL